MTVREIERVEESFGEFKKIGLNLPVFGDDSDDYFYYDKKNLRPWNPNEVEFKFPCHQRFLSTIQYDS